MTWTNPPPSVVDSRDMFLQLATVTGTLLPALTLVQRQARCHYPRAAITDTLPLITFRRETYAAKRVAATSYAPTGKCTINVVVDDSLVDDGTLESILEGIVNDLCSLGFGGETSFQMAIDAECGESIEPSPQQLAAAVTGQPDMAGCSFRMGSVSWNWEG